MDEMTENLNYWRDKFHKAMEQRDAALLQVDEMQKRIYKIGLLCDRVIGLEHGFCPDTGEPRDNITRIKIALERFIQKPKEDTLPLDKSVLCRIYVFCKCGERFCVPHQQFKMMVHCRDCKAAQLTSDPRLVKPVHPSPPAPGVGTGGDQASPSKT